ncbi:MAG: DUF11 domain-containing protein, partial [Flavobacteriaceae bacterium]|nr:DUF11 domain-containing protein [Flavobacteriaceae bacterium]
MNWRSTTTFLSKRIGILWLLLLLFSFNSIQAQNCTVNAGLDQQICENEILLLDGNDPLPRIGDPLWSQISGPAVIIDSPNTEDTTVSGYTGGNTYVFQYSAVCGDGIESSQTVTVTVEPITPAQAGMDLASCPDSSGSLIITGNTPLNPGETGSWQFASGNPAGVTINFPNSETTTIDLDPNSCGTTTLEWVITGPIFGVNQRCVSRDPIDITNYGGIEPVTAGPDQALSNCFTTTQSTSLSGSFGGCNLGGQVGTWSFVSGPATPSIGDVNSASTGISGLIEGTYTFRWTVNGPCASGSDEVQIVVPPATQDVTSVSGQSITVCDPNVSVVTLIGTQPEFTNEGVTWAQTGGSTVGIVITEPSNPTTQITGLSPAGGPYAFSYSLLNSATGCDSMGSFTINFAASANTISANGGNDIIGACLQQSFDVPVTTTGDGSPSYRILSGPSGATAGPFPTIWFGAGSTTTIVDLDVPGTYVIDFLNSNGGSLQTYCTDGTDTINIVTSGNVPGSNAGTGLNLACGTTSTTLSGNLIGDGFTSVWSQVSGPNAATIGSPYGQNTLVSGLIPGSYVFQYLVQGGPTCPDAVSDVTINVSSGTLTAAASGVDQSICYNSPAFLSGNAPGPGEFGTWAFVSGPDTITFSDVNDPNAVATGFTTQLATYQLSWTIDYINPGPSGCSSPSTATINVFTSDVPSPTIATASATNTCLPQGSFLVDLTGSVPSAGTGTWTVSPAAGVTFSPNVNDPLADATVPSDGVYTFTWTISDPSCGISFDSVDVAVSSTVSVDAGPDQLGLCANSVNMAATLSSGSTGTWSYISGPGGFSFSNINSPTSNVSFINPGTYVFEWLGEAGDCASDSDQVTIEIGIPPTTATVGADQQICNLNNVVLSGNAFDPNTEIGNWTILPGAPNSPTIADSTDPNLNVTALVSGIYTFRWTITPINNPLCPPTFADVTVEVWAPATSASTLVFCDTTNITLTGTEGSTGTWALTAGSTGAETITQTPANSYIASATIVPGNSYTFTYTTDAYTFTTGPGNCPGTSSTVDVDVDLQPSELPVAGPDQEICIGDTTIATMAGTTDSGNPVPVNVNWSIIFEPTGSTAVVDTPNSATTTISGLTVPGLYVLEWTFTEGICSVSDIVRIEMFEPPSAAEAGPDNLVACQLDYLTSATPPAVGLGTWTFEPGGDPTGIAVIDNTNNPVTSLSNITDNTTYVLTWTVTNGPFTLGACAPQVDTVSVTFNDEPPTEADAGPDQQLCDQTSTNLNAVPVISGIGTWTQISGPTAATIASPNNPNSLILGLSTGTYEFQWETTTNGNDGCFFQDIVEVEVLDQTINADAGPDQNCVPEFTTVTLAGTITGAGTGTWSQISGPSSASFTDPNDGNTTVSGLTVGAYVFEWTVSNGICTPVTDQVTVEICGNADLELTKTVSPTAVNVGDTVTFTVAVFNNDSGTTNVDATGVEVEDVIPLGYSLVPGTVSNGGSYNAGTATITWTGLSITSGSTLNLTFDATVND